MTKPTSTNRLLANAALYSTFFVTPIALATTFGPGVTPGPVLTSAQPNNIVEVLPTGQITGAPGVQLNSLGGIVITDPHNTFVGFPTILGAGGTGINITGANGIVDIGTASGVIGAGGSAIAINPTGTGTQIFNSGVMSSATTITIFNSANNTTITNNSGGFISQASTNVNTIYSSVTGNNLTLLNAGTITQSFAGNTNATVRLDSPFNAIINESGGIIQNLNGTAISHAIDVVAASSGDIINQAGGLIYTNGVLGGSGIHIFSDTTGDIINAGTVHVAGNDHAISLVADVNSIINSGNLISKLNSTIFADGPLTIPGMIINTGNITNYTVANNALDLNMSGPVTATFVQNAGTVTGNVLLAQFPSPGASSVFFMNGGTIIGNVTAIGASTLALAGGTIAGNVTGSALGDIFNLSGTHVLGMLSGGADNDIFNVTAGSYGLLTGSGGNDTLNFNSTYTSQGTILNMESINIQNNGTVLTLNGEILTMGSGLGGTGLLINPGTTLNLNAGISGTNNITNLGNFFTNSAQVISLTGTGIVTNQSGSNFTLGSGAGLEILTVAPLGFTSQAGSYFNVDLASATHYGHLIVNSPGAGSVNFNAGSFIAPKVKGFISQGAVFDIVQNTGLLGTVIDGSTTIQSSAVVQFNKSLNFEQNAILLTARRNPYALFAIDPTTGLASALDVAAAGDGPTDANLLYLLGQIDGLATADEVRQALISLTPPSNNGLVQASYIGMNTAFERINERMYDFHLWMQQQNSGVNSGDKFGVLGFWAQALGANLNQHERNELAGYEANSGGLALGVDWRYNDCTALGFGISYNKANVNDNNENPKDEDIRSWQGTGYTWVDFANGMYVNAIMGLAFNDYDVNRTINFNLINTVSNANFSGWQIGLQTDAGWFLINKNDYFITPFARLKYVLLDLDHYTETGAGPFSLTVENESIDQLLGGIGVKFGKPFTSKHLVFIPEITAMLSYDFINDGEQNTANFVGNSLAFITNGVEPGSVAFDLGVGLSTHIDEQSVFTIKYDLTLRDNFNANSGYLEYYYLWG